MTITHEDALSSVAAHLEAFGVEKSLAGILTRDPHLARRVKVNGDGTVTVTQADGLTPLALETGDSPIRALAREVAQPYASRTEGGQVNTADDFAGIRAEVKARYGGRSNAEARERLERLR